MSNIFPVFTPFNILFNISTTFHQRLFPKNLILMKIPEYVDICEISEVNAFFKNFKPIFTPSLWPRQYKEKGRLSLQSCIKLDVDILLRLETMKHQPI